MLAVLSSSLTGLAMRMWQNDIMTPKGVGRVGAAATRQKSGIMAATRRPAALLARAYGAEDPFSRLSAASRPGQAQPPPGKSGIMAATRRPAALRLRGPTKRRIPIAG